MGCGSSKVSDGAVSPVGYGMGASPTYTGIRGSSKKPVLIVWDMDDIICPPDNTSCMQFLNVVHEEFIAKYNRIESRIVAVYDSERERNMSKEATALRLFLQSEDVELKSSDGPTVTTVDEVVMSFAVSVPRCSTIVIIGNVAEYHEACLYARKKGLFVERVLSAHGLHRLAEACHANWMCSLADFLSANNMTDWRRPVGRSFRSTSITFRSAHDAVVPEGCKVGPVLSNGEEKAKQVVPNNASQTGSSSAKEDCADTLDTTPGTSVSPQAADLDLPADEAPTGHTPEVVTEDPPPPECPPASDFAPQPTVPVAAPVSDDSPLEQAGSAPTPVQETSLLPENLAAPIDTSQPTLQSCSDAVNVDPSAVESRAERQLSVSAQVPVADLIGPGADLEDDVVNLAVDRALDNVTDMVACEMVSGPGEAYRADSETSDCNMGGFDGIADRAVRAVVMMDPTEETSDTGRKSERIVRPSMAVSMFRGRRHLAATINPDAVSDDEDEPMDIVPMVSADVPEEDSQPCSRNLCDIGPDPMMAWKAKVLRTLRAAEGSAMTITTLAALVANPVVGTKYIEHLQEHLISRTLAVWVVENESIQLI